MLKEEYVPPVHGRAKKIFREPTAKEKEEMGGGREVKAKRSRDNRAKREAAGLSNPIEVHSDDEDFITVTSKDLKSLFSNKKPKSGISSRAAIPKNISEDSEEVPKIVPEKKTGRKFVRSKPVRRVPSAATETADVDVAEDSYNADEVDGSEAPVERKDNRVSRKEAQMEMLRRAKKSRDRGNDDDDK
jgi:hypothetical protein